MIENSINQIKSNNIDYGALYQCQLLVNGFAVSLIYFICRLREYFLRGPVHVRDVPQDVQFRISGNARVPPIVYI